MHQFIIKLWSAFDMLHYLLRRTAIKGGNLDSQTSVNLLPSGILFSLWIKLVRNQYRYSVTFTTPDVSITQHYVIYMMNLQPSWYKIHRVTANSFFGYKVLDWAHNYKIYQHKKLNQSEVFFKCLQLLNDGFPVF